MDDDQTDMEPAVEAAADRGESTGLMEPLLVPEDSRNRTGFLDGNGRVARLTRFFLQSCIDQVEFMEGLVQPERLRDRILIWTEEEIRADHLPFKSGQVLEAILYRGELPRGEVAPLLGVSDRQARRITSALIEHEVLSSKSTRAPLRLAFPAKLASRWMPGLFPERRG